MRTYTLEQIGKQIAVCDQKLAYPSAGKALIAAQGNFRKYAVDAMSAYRCPICDQWHLTSKTGGDRLQAVYERRPEPEKWNKGKRVW